MLGNEDERVLLVMHMSQLRFIPEHLTEGKSVQTYIPVPFGQPNLGGRVNGSEIALRHEGDDTADALVQVLCSELATGLFCSLGCLALGANAKGRQLR